MEQEDMFARCFYFLGKAKRYIDEGKNAEAVICLSLSYTENRMLLTSTYEQLDFEQLCNLPDIETEI